MICSYSADRAGQGLKAEGDLFELIKKEVQRDAGTRKRSLSGAVEHPVICSDRTHLPCRGGPSLGVWLCSCTGSLILALSADTAVTPLLQVLPRMRTQRRQPRRRAFCCSRQMLAVMRRQRQPRSQMWRQRCPRRPAPRGRVTSRRQRRAPSRTSRPQAQQTHWVRIVTLSRLWTLVSAHMCALCSVSVVNETLSGT